MAYNPTTDIHNKKNANKGFLFHALKWLLILALIVTSLSLFTKPLRKKWSDNYVAKGDIFLEQKKYITADLQYKKALALFLKNAEAKERIELCDEAQADVIKLREFIGNRNTSAQISLFDLATSVPSDEIEATKNAKELIEKEEFQLARVAAETATEMDPGYREGWLYLGIADLKIDMNSEMTAKNHDNYRNEAKTAFEKALEIDPNYELTKQYLAQVN